jgi:HAD superfamily hydrolase (TIGR01509 family)
LAEIKNIIFDLGGVILNLDFKRAEQAFIDMGMKNFNELFASGQVKSFFKDYEVGLIDDVQFIKELRNAAGAEHADEVVIAAWNAMLGDFPKERIEFLNGLKKKYRLFLFSNTNAIHLQSFRKTYTDSFPDSWLDDHFETAYYSHEIKQRKPDKKAFEYVLKQSGLKPEETLFIDDSLPNIEGAKEAGLQTIHLRPGMSITELGL